MSDGILSQDEIDALLGRASGGPDALDGLDVDAVAEFVRLIAEAGIERLGGVLNANVSLKLARSQAGPLLGLIDQERGPQMAMEASLKGRVEGSLVYLLSESSATMLGSMMAGGDLEEEATDEELAEGFESAMDQLGAQLKAAMTAILGSHVDVAVDKPKKLDLASLSEGTLPIGLQGDAICCEFDVQVARRALDLQILVPSETAARLLEAISDHLDEEPDEFDSDATQTPPADEAPTLKDPELKPGGDRQPGMGDHASPFEFSDFEREATRPDPANLDFLLDVPLHVTVELGRTRMQIRDILELGKGSVIELDKLAGEPVEVFVNGKLIATGEVVTIDENFGVKITDIVSRRERVNNLQ